MKRIINIKATNDEIEEICDAISKMDIDCSIESKVSYSKDEIINILRIKVYGHDKIQMMQDYKNIMNLADRIHKKYKPNKIGLFEYQLNDVKYPVNKELLKEAIGALDIEYKYDEEKNIIKCSLPLEELHDMTKELYGIYKELDFTNVGPKPVKNIITVISYITKKDIYDIIDESIEQEFLREENDKIVLNKDIKLIKEYFLNK
ncbi:DUF2067 domain-containing protein [Methanococcus aeolicus]|uniref:Uncharacterized protein n=1 Tax=Methanococcus aeolicus (strain ATCC BAA-1280 / DSM 17508 / OCM 812 / Nankai-3) TaxID=419665 RepID=A6UTG3_META3|nr:DUF2067 domain-containing protein [Methanococcus aeolicus]ABR55785.1 conserved hypothetical protein [Methanococcus aeolicus Nankai-3]UXM84109.1 DUF2067 domain-containing protein [Methanococcus aeolicus]